jgi:hypothetical protein
MCEWEGADSSWWRVRRVGQGFAVDPYTPDGEGDLLCSRLCLEKWITRWGMEV